MAADKPGGWSLPEPIYWSDAPDQQQISSYLQRHQNPYADSTNQHYRGAHGWARLLLGAGGLDDLLVHGSWQAGSLLIDMHRLWERIVVRLCDEMGARPVAISPPIRVREDPLSARAFPPDALLTVPGGYLPVDAKYKDYRASIVDRSDAHQLLTYAAAFRTALDADPVAILVYPYDGPSAQPRTVRVMSPGRPGRSASSP